MAAITPTSTTKVAALGPFRLTLAKFTTVSVNDTWTSGILGVLGQWGSLDTVTTQASAGLNVVLTTASTGVFTFKPGEDAHAMQLYIISTE